MQKKLHKPPGLLYGVHDRPANWTLNILGVEHGALLITSLMASVFFAQEIGATNSQTISLIKIVLDKISCPCCLQESSF